VATLAGRSLPFDPNAVRWSYKLNTRTEDTLGGRVIQILSTSIESLTWEADAGSRDNLLAIVDTVVFCMQHHVTTQDPVRLEVPSRGWFLDVYARSMPEIGWGVEDVAFPYRITFEVEEDQGGAVTQQILSAELARLSAGVGYDPLWHGGEGVDPYAPDVATGPNGSGNGEGRVSNWRTHPWRGI